MRIVGKTGSKPSAMWTLVIRDFSKSIISSLSLAQTRGAKYPRPVSVKYLLTSVEAHFDMKVIHRLCTALEQLSYWHY